MSFDYDTVGADVRETKCPGGPLLVHGADVLVDGEGRAWPVTRPVVALCRCRRSDRKPWCDGSHKLPPDPPPREGGGSAGEPSVRT